MKGEPAPGAAKNVTCDIDFITMSALLARLGLSIWIPIAVAVIVGLHFIPLARVFEVPLYY